MFRGLKTANTEESSIDETYIYVNPSMNNDVTIRNLNEWAEKGYRVVGVSVGMIIMEKTKVEYAGE